MLQDLSPLMTEYRVIPVTRYLMTRYEPYWDPRPGHGGMRGSEKVCEFESEAAADQTARLLRQAEYDRLENLDAIGSDARQRLIDAHLHIKDEESKQFLAKAKILDANGALKYVKIEANIGGGGGGSSAC